MPTFLAPTKGNLINLKRTLKLSKLGFELMDRKRNILIREMMPLVEVAKTIRKKVEQTFKTAYKKLEKANISLGDLEEFACHINIEQNVEIKYKSVMGLDIPKINLKQSIFKRNYKTFKTNASLDMAVISFLKVKEIVVILAEIENGAYLLAQEIKKTKIRANALENIVIPNIERNIKYITDAIEEKEREEFSRLKIIKKTKLD